MSTREYFVKRWESELAAFGKVLRAVPDNQLSYKPHDKCTAAGALALQLAHEQQQMVDLVDKGETHISFGNSPEKAAEIVAAWDKAADEFRKRMKNIDDAKWSKPATMMMNGKAVWTDTTENMLWGYLFDMVHHRGQLSAYLRPMGAKVPSIYGPSADDMGG